MTISIVEVDAVATNTLKSQEQKHGASITYSWGKKNHYLIDDISGIAEISAHIFLLNPRVLKILTDLLIGCLQFARVAPTNHQVRTGTRAKRFLHFLDIKNHMVPVIPL